MTNYEMVPLIVNSTMCFTTAVMLLSIKSDSQFGSNRFDRIKQMLAFCGLIEFVKTLCVMACDYFHIDWLFLVGFLDSDLYWLQLCMISMGLLGLVHSPLFTDKKLLIAASPFGVFTLVHLVAYIFHSGFDFSVDSYLNFLNTKFSQVYYWVMYAFILLEILLYFYLLVTETRRYRHHLVNLLSGTAK